MGICRLATTTLIAATLGFATNGLGQPAPAPTAPTAAARPATGATLSVAEVIERLSREGYTDVNEVKRKSDRLYKVSALSPQGRRMELSVDGRTGEVLASEEDDDD